MLLGVVHAAAMTHSSACLVVMTGLLRNTISLTQNHIDNTSLSDPAGHCVSIL